MDAGWSYKPVYKQVKPMHTYRYIIGITVVSNRLYLEINIWTIRIKRLHFSIT